MANLMSKLRNLVCSAAMAGTMLGGGPALASEVELFPSYTMGGEVSRKLIGNPRLNGYAELRADVDFVSYRGFSFGMGTRFMNFFRQRDTTTWVQPDAINYDVWGELSYNDHFGEIGFSYYHQCMHSIDEDDKVLANESRSHNILRLKYKNKFDVLEGLELLVALGPYIQVYNSGYIFYLDAEAQLSLFKLWDTGELYLRTRKNPIVAEKSDGWWELNSEDEAGVEVIGKKFSMQFFLEYMRVEDYFMFESGKMDLFLFGIRIR